MICDSVLREIVGPDFVTSVHRAELTLSSDPQFLHVFIEVELKQALLHDY